MPVGAGICQSVPERKFRYVAVESVKHISSFLASSDKNRNNWDASLNLYIEIGRYKQFENS